MCESWLSCKASRKGVEKLSLAGPYLREWPAMKYCNCKSKPRIINDDKSGVQRTDVTPYATVLP